MLGRQVCQDPWLLARLHGELIAPGAEPPGREAVVLSYADYVDRRLATGDRVGPMLRHAQGLFAGCAGARAWRRLLGERACRDESTGDVLRHALPMLCEAA
jgi:tRNA-dihydrouridine synthase A